MLVQRIYYWMNLANSLNIVKQARKCILHKSEQLKLFNKKVFLIIWNPGISRCKHLPKENLVEGTSEKTCSNG